jgi:thymidylate synthase
MKNGLDEQYIDLLKDILNNGVEKNTRNGKTLSVFGRSIRYKFKDGKFPLLTTKKMAWKTMVVELLWFLRGETNIKFLLDYDCHLWDGDAYKNWKNKGRDYWEEQVDGIFTSELGEDEVDKISMEWFINKIKTDDEFAKQWGELGPIYGKQWRKWPSIRRIGIENGGMIHKAYPDYGDIDQIQNLINDLKTNPDSRRLMVNAWNVGELDQMVLPPCHYGFQVYTRELSLEERLKLWDIRFGFSNEQQKNQFNTDVHLDTHGIPKRAISLMWNQRSVDTPLGLPFNIASYALLLEIIAKEVNMIPDELIGNLGDCHIYKNQIDGVKEQLTREPFDLPKVKITERNWYLHPAIKEHLGEKSFDDKILSYRPECFELIEYKSHPKIKMPLSN